MLKTALVDAAERVIDTRGLPALRARDLAQEVGCAVGAIYTAFSDLDALILEVNVRTLGAFETALARTAGSLPMADSAAATTELVRLGHAYLDFAAEHPRRWRALFQHRMSDDRTPPDWYVAEKARLFRLIEAPLGLLCPHLSDEERAFLARTMFSATHGVVDLGLDEKLAALPPDMLRPQLETVIRAMATGLALAQTAFPR